MSLRSNSVVAICTRNRPLELKRCILAATDSDAATRDIYVVDSSEGVESAETCQLLSELGIPIRYFRYLPGLTRQRNFLISQLPPEVTIVHFIDDDSVVGKGYFDALEKVLDSNIDAVGAGGLILNLPIQKYRLLDRLFLAASKKQGVVLSSGINILNFSGIRRDVDWLSGCSMSFRAALFAKCLFDERRQGNGIGEDVDFCLRAKEFGRIIWEPNATQLHLQSPINRLGYKANRKKVLEHRLRLASDKLGSVKKVRVFVAFFYESLLYGSRPFLKRMLRKNA